LNEFHKRGLLHNDLKEDNVIVCSNKNNKTELDYPQLKLIDFGLVEEECVTRQKELKSGTPIFFVCFTI
jgi:serine/threonine protein kinase